MLKSQLLMSVTIGFGLVTALRSTQICLEVSMRHGLRAFEEGLLITVHRDSQIGHGSKKTAASWKHWTAMKKHL